MVDEKKTILVADDEECLLRMIELCMEQEGHEVLTAADGQEAVDLMAEHPAEIDLLITDVRMPGVDGVELAERFALAYPAARVICMSAFAAEEVDARIGGIEFLPKPFMLDQLTELVEACLVPRSEN